MTETTFCVNCDRVHGDTQKLEPWRWRCLAVKTMPGFGFVDPQYSPDPPYRRCSEINTVGHCEFFEPKREPS